MLILKKIYPLYTARVDLEIFKDNCGSDFRACQLPRHDLNEYKYDLRCQDEALLHRSHVHVTSHVQCLIVILQIGQHWLRRVS